MKAEAESLLDDFIKKSLGNQYVIPVYQRNYTWNKNKHVKQLLTDIKSLLNNEKDTHFLGTIVYAVKEGHEITEREIVDGQQRLTTVFLMLYALKNIALEISKPDEAGRITEEYLENKYVNDKYKLRLKPLVSDDNVYQKIAEGVEINLEEKVLESKVYINYCYIKEEFKQWIIEEGFDIASIRKAIDKLKIVYIKIDAEDDAQSIFESINSTGETLTPADLIRNYVLMKKRNEEQEIYYRDYWLVLERYMKEDSKKIAEFFRFFLAVKSYNLCNQNSVYDSFKQYWRDSKVEEDLRLQEIVKFAKYYYILYLSEENEITVAKQSIKELRKIKSNMPAPFLIKIMELQENGVIKEEQLEDIISIINIYLIRRHMMKLDTSDITRYFPQLLRNVINLCEQYQYDNIVDIVKKCLVNDNRQKSAYMPDDKQLKSYLWTANAYALIHTRMILDKIEHIDNTAPVDLSKLNIEHIMPQTPNDYWIKYTNGDRQEYDMQINRIGNLTLVSKIDNSVMGNSNFEKKKKVLEDTLHINMNKEIYEKEEWTVNEIDNRTNKIIDLLIQAYPYCASNKDYIDNKKDIMINITREDIYAVGILKDKNEVEVLQGSEIRYSTLPTRESYRLLRKQLIDEEIIVNENGKWVFDQNYSFSTVSAAANIILGGNYNGWYIWKDDAGKRIGEHFRKDEENMTEDEESEEYK